MTPISTEMTFDYSPEDFFEAEYRHSETDHEISISNGKVRVSISTPRDPIDPEMSQRIRRQVEMIFQLRSFQIHKPFDLKTPITSQVFPEGRRNIAEISGQALIIAAGQADFQVIDKAGNVVRDTKKERIADHTAFLDSCLAKTGALTTLLGLLASYNSAINDPNNELIHLYEIRDGLSKEFGNESKVRTALGVPRSKWQRLGELCNGMPLFEGRHRGGSIGQLRKATPSELEEARVIAAELIRAYVNYLQ